MKKGILSVVMIAVLAAGLLTACSSNKDQKTGDMKNMPGMNQNDMKNMPDMNQNEMKNMPGMK